VAAGAGGDERNSRLPDGAGKEALEGDTTLTHANPPHPPGFHRLGVVRDRIGVQVDGHECRGRCHMEM
jgi:hypothetical protein